MNKDDLIKKWLNNELNDAETKAFNTLEDAEFNQYLVDYAQHFKASHFSKMDDFNSFKARYNSHKTPVKKLRWTSTMLKIASVVVIVLGVYFTLFSNSEKLVQTLAAQKTTFELPDHSIVQLNALSSISYNSKTWHDNRVLELKGEAFFKVSKGKTFDVKTANGIVTVVGTEFNVKERDQIYEVECFEGIVKVTSGNYSKTLLAGDRFTLLDNQLTEDKTSATVPQWTQHKTAFKATPFKAVIAEMERQYDISIAIENVDTDRLFTGGFTHNNLENALLSITQPMGLNYIINASNQVVIHGNKK